MENWKGLDREVRENYMREKTLEFLKALIKSDLGKICVVALVVVLALVLSGCSMDNCTRIGVPGMQVAFGCNEVSVQPEVGDVDEDVLIEEEPQEENRK